MHLVEDVWVLLTLALSKPVFSLPCFRRAQEEPYWSINRLFGRNEAGQDLREVSVEPDAERKGPQTETRQPKSGSLRDSGGLTNQTLVSPGARSDADLDGTSTSADVYDVM